MLTFTLKKQNNEKPRGVIGSVDVSVPENVDEMIKHYGKDATYRLAFDALKVKMRADAANMWDDDKSLKALFADYVPQWGRTVDPAKAKEAMIEKAKKLAASGQDIGDLIAELQKLQD